MLKGEAWGAVGRGGGTDMLCNLSIGTQLKPPAKARHSDTYLES